MNKIINNSPDDGTNATPDPVVTNARIKNAPAQIDGHNFNPKQRIQYSDASYTVHSTRAMNPEVGEITDEASKRHQQSLALYPGLNISRGEYVISRIMRHSIGVIMQLIVVGIIVVALLAALVLYPSLPANEKANLAFGSDIIMTVLIGLIVLTAIGGYIGIWVYRRNVMFLTNESIIQELQISLFARKEQTVSLGSIEDARYEQTGIIQMVFNYGTIKLSIEGDDREYAFPYTPKPKTNIDIISNAIESFKNGRPVEG